MEPALASPIRVVIAEDQAMVLGALAALLDMEGDISVVAQVRNGTDALRTVEQQRPDLLITDIEMPGMNGIDLAAAVRLRSRTRVIIVTTFARPGYLRRAIDAGAMGYLLKDSPARELASAVRRVQQGHRVIDSELAAEAVAEPDPLTDRERQVLRLAADGATSHDIATALGLSEGTVRNYLSEAIGKLGAVNRVDASRIARSKGWL
jgi:two-component system, NarL family, response regulator DesR